ncbi:MAG: hypothetical protein CK424_01950 [Legionella sp.]|nr:MAG: hypothetical protein CK424_01950 [Legionella sp.]
MCPLNKVVLKTPQELVDSFSLCVEGQLNDSSLGFLRSVAKSNAAGVQKLVGKLQQLHLCLKADAVHLVIAALTDQLNIPRDAMATIQQFLKDDSKKTLFTELETICVTRSPLQQSVSHIMTQLGIFSESDSASHFLRLVMSIMMEWSSEFVQRSPKDAAKWIKHILGIPYKSDMSHIIHLITDHFYLSTHLIEGESRDMDCLELFFLLQNLTLDTDLVLVADTNKKMMVNIHATMLTVMICKHSPYAFYDVVALQEQHPDDAIVSLLKSSQDTPLELDTFFQNSEAGFKEYYSQKDQGNPNPPIFMNALITKIYKTITVKDNDHQDDAQSIQSVLALSQEKLQQVEYSEFIVWFKTHVNIAQFEPMIHALLFDTGFDVAQSRKSSHTGRIRASALQLVTLGFSHRSAASLTTGTFQPLVNTDIAMIDAKNMASMALYFHQQSQETRIKLTQEFLLLTIIYAHHLTIKHQNQMSLTQKSVPLSQFNTATVDMVPQKLRGNPLQRERLFTPKMPVAIASIGPSQISLNLGEFYLPRANSGA